MLPNFYYSMPRLSLFKNILFLLFLLFLSVASCHCNFSFYSFKPMNFVGFQSLVSLPFLATFIVFLWWFLPASGCLFLFPGFLATSNCILFQLPTICLASSPVVSYSFLPCNFSFNFVSAWLMLAYSCWLLFLSLELL